jgi:hypothetical protein
MVLVTVTRRVLMVARYLHFMYDISLVSIGSLATTCHDDELECTVLDEIFS